jgi:hypothetical protein
MGLMRCNVPVVELGDSSRHVTLHWSPLKRSVWNTEYEEHVDECMSGLRTNIPFFIIKFDPGIKIFYGKNRLEKFRLLMYVPHRQF